MSPTPIAIVGVGKIVRDQHIPALAENPAFQLAAAASPHSRLDDVPMFKTLENLLREGPEVDAVAVCSTPQVRYGIARTALLAGKHVLLEKPPGATISEVLELSALAEQAGVTLFASWHSRHSPAVAPAREWVRAHDLARVEIAWKEDVRRWHPKQDWIWSAGGLGVFDPGVNALSIATAILPPFFATSAELSFPSNREAPIAATLAFRLEGAEMHATFDWRQTGEQIWEIRIDAKDGGRLHLSQGGEALAVDGQAAALAPSREYGSIYERFAALIAERRSEVDVRPLQQAADAFLLGKRIVVESFDED